jgi:hypothetical protein
VTAAFIKDAIERIVMSFVEGAIGCLLAGQVTSFNASTVHVLVIAGLVSAVATAKVLFAGMLPGTQTPASLAPASHGKGK